MLERFKRRNQIARDLCIFILFMFLSCLSVPMVGQSPFSSQVEMEKALVTAKKYMISQQGDKALPITKSLIKQLERERRYNSNFGFQARLIHGLALYHSSEEVPSLDFLWKLKDESKIYKEWSVFADVCRDIAKIQEISGQLEEAYQNLEEAKGVIEQYNIDTIYASFAVRYSSWHRVSGDLETAYFYAQEAIQKGQEYGQIFEEAEGNLLLGLIIRSKDKDNSKGIYFLKRAVFLYQKIETFTSSTSMHINLGFLYLDTKDHQKALEHIDTAINYTTKYLNEDPSYSHRSYKCKGETFKELGVMDSAFIYLTKGYEAKLKFTEYNKQKEVVKVGKKYKIEKKTKELKDEKEKNRLLLFMVVSVVFFLIVLFFYYSKLRKANELTQQQSEELKNLDQLKSRFLANVSHELRTPLTLILAPLREILEESQLPKNTRLNLSLVEKNAQRLHQMVNEILDLSKLDADKMIINTEAINWHLYLKQTFANFESLAALRKINFRLEYKSSETLVVALDRLKIDMIFNNLLSNAFKFTPVDGSIIINAGVSDPYLWAEIRDTGRGISEEDLPYIFDRFYQTKNKNKAAEGGTGIGLALAQEIIALLKGTIEVESELGKTTTFKLKLPIEAINEIVLMEQNSNENKITTEAIPLVISTKNKVEKVLGNKVLLVEDNPDLLLFIQGVLEEYYIVITAANGQEALEKLAKFSDIQLVVSDVMMPIMDGFQLLNQLKTSEEYKNLPVIMLTARASLNDKLKALRIGVDDYLTKPFVKEELIVRIENLLRNAAGRKEAMTYELEETAVKIAPIERLTPLVETDKKGIETQKWLDNLEQVVLKNIELSEFTIDDISAEIFMSKRQLYRKIKQHIGVTPLQYVKNYKLNYARGLLEDRKVNSVKAAAYSIGYPSTIYFRREFKKAFGRVPSDYLA